MKIAEGSLWRSRQSMGLQTLAFCPNAGSYKSEWILEEGLETYVRLKKGDLIQFLKQRTSSVFMQRTRYNSVEPIVDFLVLPSVKKVTISLKTSSHWENWWLNAFEHIST